MSAGRKVLPPPLPASSEDTQRVSLAEVRNRAKEWKRYRFASLEKVSGRQSRLLNSVDWLLPGVGAVDAVGGRMSQLLDTPCSWTFETAEIASGGKIRRAMGKQGCFAVWSAAGVSARALVEVDLSLAHAAVDRALGGQGEPGALRPLTDIEAGVFGYLFLELLRLVGAPAEQAAVRLTHEGMAADAEDAFSELGSSASCAVLQYRWSLGTAGGAVRFFLPDEMLRKAKPEPHHPARAARRNVSTARNLARLAQIEAVLRAEIGSVSLTRVELQQLQERDVLVLESLSLRADLGEPGTANLKVGLGRRANLQAELSLVEGKYQATISNVEYLDAPDAAHGASLAEASLESSEGGRGSTDMSADVREEGAELLNDIPMEVAVELGRVAVTAEEVLSLRVGQVVDLHKIPGEPVDLSVNGRVVARGELVEVDGNLGVRILALSR